MNTYLLLAAVLAAVVGIVHSVLGEHLIFRRMRKGTLIPTNGGNILRERHVRILWATWHGVTVLGWLIAVLLLWLALHQSVAPELQFVFSVTVSAAMSLAAILVFIATRAQHPGWAGLIGVAILTWMGRAP